MRLGLIQSGQRKVAADSPFQRAGCTSPPAVRPQNATGRNERRAKMRITNTHCRRLRPLSAVFDASGNVRRSGKKKKEGGGGVRDNSPLNSNSLESDCV